MLVRRSVHSFIRTTKVIMFHVRHVTRNRLLTRSLVLFLSNEIGQMQESICFNHYFFFLLCIEFEYCEMWEQYYHRRWKNKIEKKIDRYFE